MFLHSLNASNFRNHSGISLSFSSRFVVLVGNNGTGKTNLLDAIHYLSMGKSYFHAYDEVSVLEGEQYFMISGTVEDENSFHSIKISFRLDSSESKSKKFLFKNERSLKTLSEHIGFFPVVMVCPQDMELIYGASEIRRKYVNELLCQVFPEYLQSLASYRRTLQQRNKYLKTIRMGTFPDEALLDAYDKELSQWGSVVLDFRSKWLESFLPVFTEIYRDFSPRDEWPSIGWRFSSLDENLFSQLLKWRRRDMEIQSTSIGPHKDDLLFFLNRRPLKNVASQGQLKSFMLALKMAGHEYIRSNTGKTPVLLLDDIYDKLDALRFGTLISRLRKMQSTQVFLTDTHPDRMHLLCENTGINAQFVTMSKQPVDFTGEHLHTTS